MKRGCLVSLLTWAILSGAAYYYLLHGRFTPPADRWGALAAGFFTSILLGALRNGWSQGKDVRRAEAAAHGEFYGAPEDGQALAAYGTIRAMREPLRSPFTDKPVVYYSYEIDHIVQRKNGADTVRDYSGVALTPCAVDTPYGPIRILTWPALENFPKDSFTDGAELNRAREFVRTAPFTKVTPFAMGTVYRELKDLMTDDDGEIRKDWQIGDSDPELPDHTAREEAIGAGEQVCAIGKWSQERGALLPDTAGGQVRIVRGAPQEVISKLRTKRASTLISGVMVALIGNGITYGVLTMRESHPSTKRILAGQLFDAVRSGDLAGMRKAVDDGAKVDVLDPSSDEAVLHVAPDGKTAHWLIEHGADVNARNSKGETPLIVQSADGRLDVVQELVDARAQLEATDSEYKLTALQRALDSEHLEIAELLRKAGAHDATITERNGSPIDESHPAFAVVKEYLNAIFDEKQGAILALSTYGTLNDVDFKTWKASRTHEPHMVSGFANEQAATIVVRGPRPDGGSTTWTYQLTHVKDVWRVSEERWETRLENQ